MGGRLIIISNRVAVPGEAPAAGGLAVAVDAALSSHPGMWFGWSGTTTADLVGEPRFVTDRGVDYGLIDLDAQDFQEYYNGYANRVLWPILHYRLDLAEFSRADLTGYIRVNNIFALALSKLIGPDDVIWVHDYHLIPLGYLLRAQGHQNRMGFFLHIPCPPPDVLNALPRHRDVMGTLASYDVVGLQTEQDCANLAAYFVQNGSEQVVDGVFWSGSRSTVLKAFPVGIDAKSVAAAADHPDSRMLAGKVEASLNGADLMIGVDRLDYSKGLTNRMEAISSLFERHPEWICHATFLQIAPKSRTDIPEYVAMDRSVSAAAGNINGQFGDLTWAPIRYVNKSYSREELAALYRLARVGIVTPLRDGMNLVAKEYVAAQDPDDPGVLILSEFAGAAAELDGALLVNPYEVEGVATAIDKALRMELDERRARYERMRATVFENDIHAWARAFIAHLAPDPPAATLSQAG